MLSSICREERERERQKGKKKEGESWEIHFLLLITTVSGIRCVPAYSYISIVPMAPFSSPSPSLLLRATVHLSLNPPSPRSAARIRNGEQDLAL